MIIISDFISILNWFRKSKETNRKGSDVLCHVCARGNQDAGRLEERSLEGKNGGNRYSPGVLRTFRDRQLKCSDLDNLKNIGKLCW